MQKVLLSFNFQVQFIFADFVITINFLTQEGSCHLVTLPKNNLNIECYVAFRKFLHLTFPSTLAKLVSQSAKKERKTKISHVPPDVLEYFKTSWLKLSCKRKISLQKKPLLFCTKYRQWLQPSLAFALSLL